LSNQNRWIKGDREWATGQPTTQAFGALMENLAGRDCVKELDTANLNDSMPICGIKPRRLRIDDNLAQTATSNLVLRPSQRPQNSADLLSSGGKTAAGIDNEMRARAFFRIGHLSCQYVG
jgi:hypothetical protein